MHLQFETNLEYIFLYNTTVFQSEQKSPSPETGHSSQLMYLDPPFSREAGKHGRHLLTAEMAVAAVQPTDQVIEHFFMTALH